MTPPLQEYSSVLYYTKLYYTKHFGDHSNIWAKFILTNEQIPIIQIFYLKSWEYTAYVAFLLTVFIHCQINYLKLVIDIYLYDLV